MRGIWSPEGDSGVDPPPHMITLNGQDQDHHPAVQRNLDHFRKQGHQMGGGNYQTLINDALREYIRRGGIEAAVRRAVREELRGAGLQQAAG
jgi:hypothetical protein